MNPHTKYLLLHPNFSTRSSNIRSPTALLEYMKAYNPFNFSFQTKVMELINNPYMDLCHQDSETGKTPLMYAIEYNMTNIALELLKYPNKSCPEIQNVEGKTALMYALTNNEQIVKALLDPNINCNINAIDSSGKTALMIAVMYNYEIINELLNHPLINLCIKNNNGETALMKALDRMHLWNYRDFGYADIKKIYSTLIRHSKNCINFKNNMGKTALMYAVTATNTDFVDALLPYSDVAAINNEGDTVLIMAINRVIDYIRNNMIDNSKYKIENLEYRANIVIKLLNSNNSNPGYQNYEGKTALMLLCNTEFNDNEYSKLAIINLISIILQTSHSCPECKDNIGYTTLMYARMNGHRDIINVVINYIEPILKSRLDRAFRNLIHIGKQVKQVNLYGIARHIIDEWKNEYGVQFDYNIRDIKTGTRGVDYDLYIENSI